MNHRRDEGVLNHPVAAEIALNVDCYAFRAGCFYANSALKSVRTEGAGCFVIFSGTDIDCVVVLVSSNKCSTARF